MGWNSGQEGGVQTIFKQQSSMRYSTLGFVLEGPLNLEFCLEPITECGSRDLLAHVFRERWFLLAPWIRTELHILRDLLKSYLQRAYLVRGDCIVSVVGG
jgi:hypothetical protein